MTDTRPEIKIGSGIILTDAQRKEHLEAEMLAAGSVETDGKTPEQINAARSIAAREFAGLSRQERKAKLARILERGIVHDRLHVELPPDLHGEWIRKDPLEIKRMQTLGFWMDTEYAPKRALHSDGTGAAGVGDVVYMLCERERKEIIDELRHDQLIKMNGKPGDVNAKSKEELEFEANNKRETGGEIQGVFESKTHSARARDVADALQKIGEQTAPQT